MAQGTGRRNPAAEFRHALIDALIEIPYTNALADRRLLINLIRSESADFPEMSERTEARPHVIEIVAACHEHPDGLRSLLSALDVMAPETAGTRQARRLIESASLLSLLPEAETKRARELLRRAADLPQLGSWRELVEETAPHVRDKASSLVHAFEHLAALGPGQHGVPPALTFVRRVADELDGAIASELGDWTQEQAERLGIVNESVSGAPGDDSAQAGVYIDEADEPPDSAAEHVHHERSGITTGLAETRVSPKMDEGDIKYQPDNPSTAEDGDPMASGASTRRVAEKLPQMWGDVPPRNPHFTGREALLSQLHSELRAARETAVLPQALHGMGGVAKSQVAIEYVHRHSSEFDLVWWIPSEQPGLVLTSLTKLAQRLGLEASPEANSAVPAVKEALSTGRIPHENWLLVFDNAEDLHEVRSYFPTGGAGKILVTSRNPDWAGVSRALEVDVFTREESTQFLTNRTPELSEVDADRLAEALGDLPLAIEQAAAWRATTGMPVDDYLELLKAKRIELLDDTSSPDYPKSVAAAWNVSFDRLEQVNVAALQLLQVCSFFAPEPISRELFAGSPIASITPELDETLSDPIRLARGIRDIQRYALAKFDHRNDTLQMHRLVQAVLVGRMDEAQREAMRRGAHTLLANGDPNQPGRRTRWDRYQGLRPHLMVSRAVESDDPRVQELVFRMVEFLNHWGDHEGCKALADEAYQQRLHQLGETHPQTLWLAKYRGYIRWVLGRYEEAEQLNARTLELYLSGSGEEDEGTVDAMAMMATSLRAKGDFAAARELDERAYGIARRVFGADDPTTLAAAHSLGVSLRLTAEFRRAAELDADTYQRREILLGRDADTTLLTLNGLTIDQRESGDYLGAHIRQEETYQRYLTAFGTQSPWVMRAARNLAVARRKAGNHEAARKLAEETLEKFRRRYGDDYPDTMAAAMNVAVDLRHAGDLDAARELGEATLARYQRTFGTRHPHTLSAQANLAIVRRLLGDLESAYRTNKEAFEALAGALGPDHAVTLTCATNLASDLFALGDAQAAFERDTDTLARSERVLGVEHPSTLACGVNLALDLRALGREQAADKIHSDTMTRYRRVLGDKHPATQNALLSLRVDTDIDPMPI